MCNIIVGDWKLKILVIGLGSMGKRRIRNLKALNEDDVIAFDPREDRRKEVAQKFNINTFSSFEDAMNEKPEVFVISVPPDIHIKYQSYAVKNDIHFFTEASVVSDGLEKVIEELKNKNIIGAASSTLRFHPAVKKIKQLIDDKEIGELCTFTYHSGQYLPDWHPWENINDFYVSKKETGGGREIVPFELSWISWIFGNVKSVIGLVENSLDMGESIDDVYHSLLKFESGINGHLLVDVVSRFAYRQMKILGKKGVIEWDWSKQRVRVFKPEKNEWMGFNVGGGTNEAGYNENIIEEMYINEIRHFLNSIRKKEEYHYSLEDDLAILNILYAIEKSSRNGRVEKI
ncbi:MAG: gfo/Idh/MocA family oxidoreductase [Candidatus Lokiarchaeota archaeon]|nr:gfo/Idh/MocA family oxidoreductase [Candidatus Lokiarchaeota archaeon]